MTPVRRFVPVLLVTAGLAVPLRGDPGPAKVRDASKLADSVRDQIRKIPRNLPIIQTLKLIDEWTWTKKPSIPGGTGTPTVEDGFLAVEFHVPNLSRTIEGFNTLPLLGEIPGTRVQHRVAIDCRVYGLIRDPKPALNRVGDRPDRLVVRLPKFERFIAEYAEDNGRFETEYGYLKQPWLYEREFREQRVALYEEILVDAQDRVKRELEENTKFLTNAVATILAKSFPDVTVAPSGSAGELVLDGFFRTPNESRDKAGSPPPPPSKARTDPQAGVQPESVAAIGALAALFVMLVAIGYRQTYLRTLGEA